MRLLRIYLLTFLLCAVALNLYLLRRYDLSYPYPLGPKLDHAIRQNHTKAIAESNPSVVMIGDSTLTKGVDVPHLSASLGVPLYSIDLPGSASTLWYLIIKNNIMKSPAPPKYLLVFFRDSVLTMPSYRVQGEYFAQIDEYASPKDIILIERAFINPMNPAEKIGESYIPMYTARREIRAEMDARLRYLPAEIIGCGKQCVDDALSQFFSGEQINISALNEAITEADHDLYTPKNLDFKKQVGQSFLPELARMSNEHGVQLILVRMKTLQFTQPFPALERYMADLQIYARANHIIVLDFFSDPRLSPDLYMDILHLNDQGKAIFTDILAETLKPILE